MPDKIDQYRSKLERELVVAKKNIKTVFSTSSISNEETNKNPKPDEEGLHTYLKGVEQLSHQLLKKNVGGETMQATFNFLEHFTATYMKVDHKINDTSLPTE